jgi:hypothetical protein
VQMEAERTLQSIQDELQVELQSRSAPAFGRFALFFSLLFYPVPVGPAHAFDLRCRCVSVHFCFNVRPG